MFGEPPPYYLIVPTVLPTSWLFNFNALARGGQYAGVMPPASIDETLIALKEANRLGMPQLWVREGTREYLRDQ